MKLLLIFSLAAIWSQVSWATYTNKSAQATYSSSSYTGTVTESVTRRFYSGKNRSIIGNSIYVSMQKGSDSTGDGSIGKPFKTISKAVNSLDARIDKVPSAFTILIGGGVYREAVDLTPIKSKLIVDSVQIPLTLRAMPNEKVFIKGSEEVTSGWTSLGSGYYSRKTCEANTSSWKSYSPCRPVEMVFYERRMLQQINGMVFDGFPLNPTSAYRSAVLGLNIWPARAPGSRISLPDYSFIFESSINADGNPEGTLIIKLPQSQSPNGRSVEIASRAKWLESGGVSRLTIQDINFEHSNTTAYFGHGIGALNIFNSNNVVLENISVAFADSACINVTAWSGASAADPQNIQIKNSDISYCGGVGINGWGQAFTVSGNRISHNNIRGFNVNWHAGGIKFVGNGGIKTSTIISNHIFKNYGSGFWCDYCWTGGNTLKSNRIFYNEYYGLHIEVSKGFTVSDNYIFSNKMNIYLRESVDNIIQSNVVFYAKTWAINIFDNFSASRALSKFGTCACYNIVQDNDIAFAMMKDGPSVASLVNIAWPQENSSDSNFYINKMTNNSPFPWQFKYTQGSSVVYSDPSSYSSPVSAQVNLPKFQSQTGNELSSEMRNADPTLLILPGETLSLKEKMDAERHFSNEDIEAYLTMASQ